MSFATPVFLFLFLPAFLIIYRLAKDSHKNVVACIFSILFYSWNGLVGGVVVLLSVAAAYLLSLAMGRIQHGRIRGFILFTGVACNLGSLISFKYAEWISEMIQSMLHHFGTDISVPFSGWGFVPLGISFYSFSILSYLLDVYWGKCKPQKNILSLTLYIMLFPKITMGPIVRYDEIQEQIERRTVTDAMICRGVERFIKGLFKKVMLADRIEPIVTYAFTTSNLNCLTAWLGIIGYLLQLYYDFSGYCDMATGLGNMMGFTFPENFRHPYMSSTVSEFWRRWHITLGAWLKDYVYLPIFRFIRGRRIPGTSRKITVFSGDMIALFCVWLITGVWHGAGINYVLFGLWYFIFIAAERTYEYIRRREKKKGKLLPKDGFWFVFIQRMITAVAVVIGQTIFRSRGLAQIVGYIHALFSFDFVGSSLTMLEVTPGLCWAFSVGILFCFPVYDLCRKQTMKRVTGRALGVVKLLHVLLLLGAFWISLVYMLSSGEAPFLYAIF